MVKVFANSGSPDQMLHSEASDVGLHCLPNTLLGISRLKWVKSTVSGNKCKLLRISGMEFLLKKSK